VLIALSTSAAVSEPKPVIPEVSASIVSKPARAGGLEAITASTAESVVNQASFRWNFIDPSQIDLSQIGFFKYASVAPSHLWKPAALLGHDRHSASGTTADTRWRLAGAHLAGAIVVPDSNCL
jgi:hypothetical protein